LSQGSVQTAVPLQQGAETKLDIAWARRVGAAIICGHDYCERFPGVIRAVDEFGAVAQLRGSLWSL
jgi:hypothetical protein